MQKSFMAHGVAPFFWQRLYWRAPQHAAVVVPGRCTSLPKRKPKKSSFSATRIRTCRRMNRRRVSTVITSRGGFRDQTNAPRGGFACARSRGFRSCKRERRVSSPRSSRAAWEASIPRFCSMAFRSTRVCRARSTSRDLTTDNIDRIEIVRGPQSTLYGPRALAGRGPDFHETGERPAGGRIQCRGGSFSTFREISHQLRLAIEKFDYSFGLSRLDTDNDRPNNNIA